MTEQELAKFMEANKEHFLEATRKAVLEKVQETVRWSLPDEVQSTVSKFMKEEIAPEVAKMLAEQKGPIMDAARRAASELGNRLAESMVKKATETMDGYRAEEVFKALLGVKSSRY